MSTTFGAMYAPRRATAGGTTRTPASRERRIVELRELGGDLVVEAERRRGRGEPDGYVVREPEREQHRLLEPLVRGPALRGFLGHAQPARVELADDAGDRVVDRRRRRGGAKLGALLPRGFDGGLQILHGGRRRRAKTASLPYRGRVPHGQARARGAAPAAKRSRRATPSAHSSNCATSAMRMYPAPGLTPSCSRPMKLPGSTETPCSA